MPLRYVDPHKQHGPMCAPDPGKRREDDMSADARYDRG